jgi:predicted DNA-binding transcriptional regulator YafY
MVYMPRKLDPDTTPGVKLLRMFRKLMAGGRKHFQLDLAEYLNCSPQAVMRMAHEIESVVGITFESGIEDRKKWYRINSSKQNTLGLEFEELRYLSICRDLSTGLLPDKVIERIDSTILNLSVMMAEKSYSDNNSVDNKLTFFSKGRIDYAPHMENIEKLVRAIESKTVCLVQYKAPQQTGSIEHRFVPGRIVSMSNALYVLGFGLNREMTDIKHPTNFAIHRIQSITLTDRQVDIEMPEYKPEVFGLPWHEPKTFKVRFKGGKSAEYVKERIWSENQALTDTEYGGVILELTTQSEPELQAWVRSFGEDAEVI